MARNKSQDSYSYWKENVNRVLQSDKFLKFSSSFSSLILGILAGFIILMSINTENSVLALGYLFTSGFADSSSTAEVLYRTTPILMTGLAFAFAYKAKLINLGVPGQFAIGSFVAIVLALNGLPWYLNIIFAFLGGALWGLLPGLMKVYFNMTEIVSSVMFDWIAVTIIFISLSNMTKLLNASQTGTLSIAAINSSGVIPSLGLENWDSNLSIAIFIAVILAAATHTALYKTKLGYEIRAYASNASVSKAVGISEKRVILNTFLISGGLAGIGGALMYLAPYSYEGYALTYTALPHEGIIGLAVAILAFNNPLFCIITALIFSYLSTSSENLMSLGYSGANVSFIIGFIIYFGSFGVILNRWIRKKYVSRAIKFTSKKIQKFSEWLFYLFKGTAKPKTKSNEVVDSIIEVANSSIETIHKEEEVSTVFIEYNEPKKEKDKILIKINPESEDLEDYNPDHYANADIPQLKRYSTDKKDGGK